MAENESTKPTKQLGTPSDLQDMPTAVVPGMKTQPNPALPTEPSVTPPLETEEVFSAGEFPTDRLSVAQLRNSRKSQASEPEGIVFDELTAGEFSKLRGSQTSAPSQASLSTKKPSKLLVSKDLITKHFKDSTMSAKDLPVRDWDRYVFAAFLGEGGMGRVYKAFDPLLNRHVALKFIRGDDPELNRRFIQEAQAQARVEHTNVCKVYEVGEVEDKLYIAMQYIAGDTLAKAKAKMTLEQKIRVLKDISDAVHAAHRIGLIHRDLKPANIMMDQDEEGAWHPYVMDFGLAREMETSGMTQSGMVMGTPWYMAPEQARGEINKLDRRTDVYSLGATIYDTLVGHPPFEGASGMDVLMKVIEDDPTPLRQHDPTLPDDLETIVMKCLEKEPQRRYDSAKALADDLQRYIDDEPILARRASWTYRFSKRVKKNKALFAVAATALLVTTTLGVIGIRTKMQSKGQAEAAQEYGQKTKGMELAIRVAYMLPLHDVIEDKLAVRKDIESLSLDMEKRGKAGQGPGNWASGRAYLALHSLTEAKDALTAAMDGGYDQADVEYTLGRVYGEIYQQELEKAERIEHPALREARIAELKTQYRGPAVQHLSKGRKATTESPAYGRALLAFYDGRADEALKDADAATEDQNWLYEAKKLKADILATKGYELRDAGKYSEAETHFKTARETYDEAISMARSDATLYEGLAKVWNGMMLLDLEQGRPSDVAFKASQEATATAIKADPRSSEAYDKAAYAQLRWAQNQMDHGEDPTASLQAAITSAQTSVKLDPSNHDGHRMLGTAHFLGGLMQMFQGEDPTARMKQAMAAFGEGLEVNPNSADMHLNLGNAYGALASFMMNTGGDFKELNRQGIASYERALQLNAKIPEPNKNIGKILWQQGEFEMRTGVDPRDSLNRGVESLKKSIKISPNYAVAHNDLGYTYTLLGAHAIMVGANAQEPLDKAIASYQVGAKIDPDDADVHNMLGEAYRFKARYAAEHGSDPRPALTQALASYDKSIAMNPQIDWGYANAAAACAMLAEHEARQGENPGASVAKALERGKKTLAINDQIPDVYVAMADAHLASARIKLRSGTAANGELQSARGRAAEALKINPGFADGFLNLGKSHLLEAQWIAGKGGSPAASLGEARKALDQAVKANPADARNFLALAELNRVQAEWDLSTRDGKKASESVKSGLDIVAKAIAINPTMAEALAVKGALYLAQARAQTDGGVEDAAIAKSKEALESALEANIHLRHEYGGLLDDANEMMKEKASTEPAKP